MEFWTSDRAKDTLARLYKKAATDEAFRSLCLQNPREAVRQFAGQDLPEGFNLRFVDNAGADLTLVLPDLRRDGELSEAQLEAVAGGDDAYGTEMCSKLCTKMKGSIFCN